MSELVSEDSAWFQENIAHLQAPVRSWLIKHFPRETEIEDIVQDATMRVLNARKQRDIASPKAYFYTVARNVALEMIRKKQARREISLADVEHLDLLDLDEGVVSHVTQSEEFEMLTLAIQSLPTRCRQILTLRKIYGLSQKEVARQLDISVHTVESQGAIALTKLTAYFEKFDRKRGDVQI